MCNNVKLSNDIIVPKRSSYTIIRERCPRVKNPEIYRMGYDPIHRQTISLCNLFLRKVVSYVGSDSRASGKGPSRRAEIKTSQEKTGLPEGSNGYVSRQRCHEMGSPHNPLITPLLV
ncbi:hypothetical protein JTE90_015970 [Oedothorax gibbosus]|uniref:Uncharacterized protein n=1 Tax=Oedothorax gibbosus TaxID=931172 RepID=A0AAV6VTU2_9ARAC|nr:hypothetical protein JTE90_015970 [Oedothorax gibbosus]